MIERRKLWVLDLYILFLAALLFLSPWLLALRYELAREESWAAGLALAIASVAALIAFRDWKEWLILLLGVWLVAAPWLLGFPHAAAMKVHIGVGLVVVYLAGLYLWLSHHDASAAPR
jgi:hypothetical protein